MVLIKTDIFGETTLVASYFLEWRSVLGSENGVTSLTVELMGVGMMVRVTLGFLQILRFVNALYFVKMALQGKAVKKGFTKLS